MAAFVQSAKGALTTAGTSVTATLGAASTVGNLLVAIVAQHLVSATITMPPGWAQAYNATTNDTFTVYTYANNPGGITGVTATSGASGIMALIVAEFSGPLASSPLDQSANNDSTTSTTAMDSGTTATTSQAVEVWWAALAYWGGSTRTISGVTSGWAADLIADGTDGSHGAHVSDYYQVTSATGAADVSATLSGASTYNGVVLTFLTAGAAITWNITDTSALSETETVSEVAPWTPASPDTALTLVESETFAPAWTPTETPLPLVESSTEAGVWTQPDVGLALTETPATALAWSPVSPVETPLVLTEIQSGVGVWTPTENALALTETPAETAIWSTTDTPLAWTESSAYALNPNLLWNVSDTPALALTETQSDVTPWAPAPEGVAFAETLSASALWAHSDPALALVESPRISLAWAPTDAPLALSEPASSAVGVWAQPDTTLAWVESVSLSLVGSPLTWTVADATLALTEGSAYALVVAYPLEPTLVASEGGAQIVVWQPVDVALAWAESMTATPFASYALTLAVGLRVRDGRVSARQRSGTATATQRNGASTIRAR